MYYLVLKRRLFVLIHILVLIVIQNAVKPRLTCLVHDCNSRSVGSVYTLELSRSEMGKVLHVLCIGRKYAICLDGLLSMRASHYTHWWIAESDLF